MSTVSATYYLHCVIPNILKIAVQSHIFLTRY